MLSASRVVEAALAGVAGPATAAAASVGVADADTAAAAPAVQVAREAMPELSTVEGEFAAHEDESRVSSGASAGGADPAAAQADRLGVAGPVAAALALAVLLAEEAKTSEVPAAAEGE